MSPKRKKKRAAIIKLLAPQDNKTIQLFCKLLK